MEAITTKVFVGASLALSYVTPHWWGSTSSAATLTAFTTDPTILYIRADNGLSSTKVNVIDGNGTIVYTIERTSRLSTQWVIYSAATRESIAILHSGLEKSVDFLGKPGLQHRTVGKFKWFDILTYFYPRVTFFLSDGAEYEWTRFSQCLERVVNPGGGAEEMRERLARMKHLRRFKFDWELLVDKSFDSEIALATAFLAALSLWTPYSPATIGSRIAQQHPV